MTDADGKHYELYINFILARYCKQDCAYSCSYVYIVYNIIRTMYRSTYRSRIKSPWDTAARADNII